MHCYYTVFAFQVSMMIYTMACLVSIEKAYNVPQSNFVFEFTTEVVCETYPQSSGFIVKVKEEGASRELFTK